MDPHERTKKTWRARAAKKDAQHAVSLWPKVKVTDFKAGRGPVFWETEGKPGRKQCNKENVETKE